MARIFITGSTDGLGQAAAVSLIGAGHEVVLHARSVERAAALGGIASHALGVVTGDLSNADAVRGIADQVNAIGHMDAIIHNAGIYAAPDRGDTEEGHAMTLAINSLAPYMLTVLIERPARLIYLSSSLHRGGEGSIGDLDWRTRPWDAGKAYAESKLHVAALAFALARRWPDVLANAVDPGWVRTRMGGSSAPVDIDTGQRTQTWLAVSDDPQAQVSGRYWNDRQVQKPAAEVEDVAFQDALIARFAELTGVTLP